MRWALESQRQKRKFHQIGNNAMTSHRSFPPVTPKWHLAAERTFPWYNINLSSVCSTRNCARRVINSISSAAGALWRPLWKVRRGTRYVGSCTRIVVVGQVISLHLDSYRCLVGITDFLFCCGCRKQEPGNSQRRKYPHDRQHRQNFKQSKAFFVFCVNGFHLLQTCLPMFGCYVNVVVDLSFIEKFLHLTQQSWQTERLDHVIISAKTVGFEDSFAIAFSGEHDYGYISRVLIRL